VHYSIPNFRNILNGFHVAIRREVWLPSVSARSGATSTFLQDYDNASTSPAMPTAHVHACAFDQASRSIMRARLGV
jgi:hypothetical protein